MWTVPTSQKNMTHVALLHWRTWPDLSALKQSTSLHHHRIFWSACAALKAAPPVQTLVPPFVWCGLSKTRANGSFMAPSPVTRSSPSACKLKDRAATKSLDCNSLEFMASGKPGPESVTHASKFCSKHTDRCRRAHTHSKTWFKLRCHPQVALKVKVFILLSNFPHSTPLLISTLGPLMYFLQFSPLYVPPGSQPSTLIMNVFL